MSGFATFGPAHGAMLVAVPCVAAALAAWARRRPALSRPIRRVLAVLITANALLWYAWVWQHGWVDPPHGLPLDLCDVVLWLTVYALVTLRPWALDAVYYLALAGSGMALVTPDVADPALPAFAIAEFFLAHGSVVAAALFLVFSGALRPRRGSWWRVLLWVNGYAAVVALVNARFGTNYMYLCEKPAAGSLLDLLGPWPWYLVGGEVVALVLFVALYLPFRLDRESSPPGAHLYPR
jgi:hypothetical integral membrane protein (TIGR02206 family)